MRRGWARGQHDDTGGGATRRGDAGRRAGVARRESLGDGLRPFHLGAHARDAADPLEHSARATIYYYYYTIRIRAHPILRQVYLLSKVKFGVRRWPSACTLHSAGPPRLLDASYFW